MPSQYPLSTRATSASDSRPLRPAASGDRNSELPPSCVEEMTADTAEALAEYRAGVAETFVPTTAEVMPLDAAQGIYMISVVPASGQLEEAVAVIVIEGEARRFVVFPRKKAE